ncbi:co-regulatory protein PtrA N-terminal domain-containing protein [Pseudomonas vancouverensis]|uniref:co-regulatory protein PtrA N-terminal domain-containing protein n=1 Tax=Pseudomonas vancouverensis TaxID=95300 RepID=UPI003D030248
MKPVQIGAFLLALGMSSLVLAEGGGDRTFEKMMAANDRSVELFVAKEKARDPVVVNDKKDDNKTQDL